MIRTIAVAVALCLASFGAFAQGSSTPTDTGTSPKSETKPDTTGTKMSKKRSKKTKKAKKSADSTPKDTAAPKQDPNRRSAVHAAPAHSRGGLALSARPT